MILIKNVVVIQNRAVADKYNCPFWIKQKKLENTKIEEQNVYTFIHSFIHSCALLNNCSLGTYDGPALL